jgi:RNA polymerase sigma factor (sigma-70 family)
MYDVDAVNVSDAMLSLAELDDGELLALTRSGHQEAYAALFQRYSYAALRLARHLGQKEESDDVVSESFAQVLGLLNRGKGPDQAFRAYLFTTVRHECARRAKARQRVMPTDDLQKIDAPVEFGAGRLDDFERSAVRAAYESLPERWRTVLWHLDVEGRKPHELGPILDLSPNSVSALVYRARSGLREAYLQQHVNSEAQVGSSACTVHRAKLSAFVRRTASARDQEKIHSHLQSCKECMAIYLDLKDINREVGSVSSTAVVAGSAAGLTAIAALSGGLASAVTNATVVAKGFALALVPTVAAAAITTVTLVGTSSNVASAESPGAATAAAPVVAQRSPAVSVPAAPAQTKTPAPARDAAATVSTQSPPRSAPVRQPAPAPVEEPAQHSTPAPAASPSRTDRPAVVRKPTAIVTPIVKPVVDAVTDTVKTLPSVIAEPVKTAGSIVLDVTDRATADLGLTP